MEEFFIGGKKWERRGKETGLWEQEQQKRRERETETQKEREVGAGQGPFKRKRSKCAQEVLLVAPAEEVYPKGRPGEMPGN